MQYLPLHCGNNNWLFLPLCFVLVICDNIVSHLKHNNLFSFYQRQYRRQKLFNRGALRFCGGGWVCAGGLDILKIDKNATDL